MGTVVAHMTVYTTALVATRFTVANVGRPGEASKRTIIGVTTNPLTLEPSGIHSPIKPQTYFIVHLVAHQ